MFDEQRYQEIVDDASTVDNVDKNHDWQLSMTKTLMVDVSGVEDVERVQVFSGNPLESKLASIVGEAYVSEKNVVSMAITYPTLEEVLYAAAIDSEDNYTVSPFDPSASEVVKANCAIWVNSMNAVRNFRTANSSMWNVFPFCYPLELKKQLISYCSDLVLSHQYLVLGTGTTGNTWALYEDSENALGGEHLRLYYVNKQKQYLDPSYDQENGQYTIKLLQMKENPAKPGFGLLITGDPGIHEQALQSVPVGGLSAEEARVGFQRKNRKRRKHWRQRPMGCHTRSCLSTEPPFLPSGPPALMLKRCACTSRWTCSSRTPSVSAYC